MWMRMLEPGVAHFGAIPLNWERFPVETIQDHLLCQEGPERVMTGRH